MSKASEWAVQRADAMTDFKQVDAQRPTGCQQVYLQGKGWYHYEVDDRGRPLLMLPSENYVVDIENLPRLLDQARWILETFGDPDTPGQVFTCDRFKVEPDA